MIIRYALLLLFIFLFSLDYAEAYITKPSRSVITLQANDFFSIPASITFDKVVALQLYSGEWVTPKDDIRGVVFFDDNRAVRELNYIELNNDSIIIPDDIQQIRTDKIILAGDRDGGEGSGG